MAQVTGKHTQLRRLAAAVYSFEGYKFALQTVLSRVWLLLLSFLRNGGDGVFEDQDILPANIKQNGEFIKTLNPPTKG